MDDLKQIITNNISQLRRAKGMTQQELAEHLNYTDKAISKWERGESIPDAIVLKKIADLFGVSMDYLFTEDHSHFFNKSDSRIMRLRRKIKNRKFIVAICIMLVWLIATLVFIILHSTVHSRFDFLCFLYAVPATFIVWLVLNTIWFSKRKNFILISLLMWSVLLSVCITLHLYSIELWYLLLLGIPGQAIILLWSRIRILGRNLKKNKNAANGSTDTGDADEPEAAENNGAVNTVSQSETDNSII